MLKVSGLSTSYGGIHALVDVSLEVADNALVALIGSNGAGKTTMLNTICGVVRAARGTVLFDGEDITHLNDYEIARRGLLQVPEGRRILGSLSVEENLLLGGLAAAGRQVQERQGLDEVYALFPVLKERRRAPGGVLSGGQQQMLAIGRAMMGRPKLLLLDEASLGLSPLMATAVFDAVVHLNSTGIAILIVEQNAKRALEITHTAYILEQGRLVREGVSTELASDPSVIDHYLGRPTQPAGSH